MNKNQFEQLSKVSANPTQIHLKDLTETRERTLLYGYTCDRDTFHVYLRNGELHKVIFKAGSHEASLYEHGLSLSIDSIVPDKRLFPEACDAEFCTLLIKAGVTLPFTTFNESRESKTFYSNVVQPNGNLSAWESRK